MMNTTEKKAIKISLKYAATCTVCQKQMDRGERAFWSGKREGVWHIDCHDSSGFSDATNQKKIAYVSSWQMRGKSRDQLADFCSEHKLGSIQWRNRAPGWALKAALRGEQIDMTDWRGNRGGKEKTTTGGIDMADVAQLVATEVGRVMDGIDIPDTPDPDKVAEIVTKILESHRQIEVKIAGTKKAKKLKSQHDLFEKLLRRVAASVPVYLVGPAGSGKTYAAHSVADALSLPFYCESVSKQTPVSKLLGYMDAHGKYVRTVFRDAFENGGVFLLDEIDAGNPNVLTALNAALANGICSFADGMVNKHSDFRVVAAANTFGQGADRQYVGRNQLDAASLDRIYFMEWGYDESLETKLGSNPEWTKRVQKIRRAVSELGIRAVISPRASIYGGQLLAAGDTREEVEQGLIWKGMTTDEIKKIKARL